jgi:hypothetical protein
MISLEINETRPSFAFSCASFFVSSLRLKCGEIFNAKKRQGRNAKNAKLRSNTPDLQASEVP